MHCQDLADYDAPHTSKRCESLSNTCLPYGSELCLYLPSRSSLTPTRYLFLTYYMMTSYSGYLEVGIQTIIHTRVCLSPYRAGIILNARHRKRNLESAINLFKCKIVSVISVETVNYGYMRKYM